jgi:DnaJ-class molecular chaperone
MNDPYDILGLDPLVDEATARRRYLELIRQHTPEKNPEKFAAIRKAYEQIQDPTKRLEARLFFTKSSDILPAIQTDMVQRLRSARIPTDVLLKLAE